MIRVQTPEERLIDSPEGDMSFKALLERNLRYYPNMCSEPPNGRAYYLILPLADGVTYPAIKVVPDPGMGGVPNEYGVAEAWGVETTMHLYRGGMVLYWGMLIGSKGLLSRQKSCNRTPHFMDYIMDLGSMDGKTMYADAHPRLQEKYNYPKHCWPGAFINQASRPQDVNCEIDTCPPQLMERVPSHPWFNKSIPIVMLITKDLAPGTKLLTNYGYEKDAQIAAKCGFHYEKMLAQEGFEQLQRLNSDAIAQ